MAVPWLVVLKNIPWGEVISGAPKVADEAKKLWTSIKREPGAGSTAGSARKGSAENTVDIDLDEPSSLVDLQAKTVQLENAVDDLHAQLVETSSIIKALADHNEVLVKHIEIHRSRIKLLAIVLAVFVLVGVFTVLKMQAVI